MSLQAFNLPPNSIDLSVVIIAMNESHNIADCIQSVLFAKQIVVLDGASQDNTQEIARSLGAQVEINSHWQGFGYQKNLALSFAKQKWVLSLDADERVSAQLAAEICQVIIAFENNPQESATAYEIPRLTEFCGQLIRHCGWTPDYVTRLWLNGKASFSLDLVHERLLTDACKVNKLKVPILHYSYPSPSHYWEKLSKYSQAWALQRYTKGVKTSMTRAVLSAIVAFVKSYFFRLGFLDGALGFAVCFMQAQAAFGKYFTLYCLWLQKRPESTSKGV